jgi:hypothetical protein
VILELCIVVVAMRERLQQPKDLHALALALLAQARFHQAAQFVEAWHLPANRKHPVNDTCSAKMM